MSDEPVEPKVGEDRKEENGEVIVPDHSVDDGEEPTADPMSTDGSTGREVG